MRVADTSAVVAAFASWHQLHQAANRAVPAGTRLVAHGALEAYSVLTRLPAPNRAVPATISEFLRSRFPGPHLALEPGAYEGILEQLPRLGISGGATYDALIALTASAAGAELVSCDLRAAATYEKCGVRATLIS